MGWLLKIEWCRASFRDGWMKWEIFFFISSTLVVEWDELINEEVQVRVNRIFFCWRNFKFKAFLRYFQFVFFLCCVCCKTMKMMMMMMMIQQSYLNNWALTPIYRYKILSIFFIVSIFSFFSFIRSLLMLSFFPLDNSINFFFRSKFFGSFSSLFDQ